MAKRSKVGSIRYMSEGRWELRINIRDEDGHPRRTSRTVDAENEVAARLALAGWVEEEAHAWDTRLDRRHVMAEALEAWYARTAKTREARSNENVRFHLDRDLLPRCGEWFLDEVDAGRLERLYDRVQDEQGLSSDIARRLHYIVRPALRLAKRWKWIASNPAEEVELPPMKSHRIVLPGLDDVVAMVEGSELRWAPFGCLLRLLLATGARLGEVAALRWGDVDWMRSEITFRNALSEVLTGEARGTLRERALVLKGTKSNEEGRVVQVDVDTLARLELQRAWCVANGAEDGPHRFVFPDLHKDLVGAMPVPLSRWKSKWKYLKADLGVTCRLHDLRHVHASVLLAQSVPVVNVSARIGHSRTSTTTDIYGHLIPRATDPGVQVMTDFLGRLLPGQVAPAEPAEELGP